jgi:uncharacterized protein YbjT (DUF2867 family)
VADRLVAVTGATGFLGRHLVKSLAAAGWRVRVLARRDVIHPLWRDIEPEVVFGGLADDAALGRLCHDADLVIHAAGLIKAHDRQAFDAVNVDGTRRVAERAPGPMILVSSLTAREPGLSDYAASKHQGEQAARQVLGDRLTVVRPPALYGPGDVETLPLFQLAAASPVLPLLDPAARIALMHVEDAARQITALAETPSGATVTLSDLRPQGYGWREIFQTAATVFGEHPIFIRVPGLALTLAAAVAGLAPKGRDAAMITVGKVREIRHQDWSVRPQEQPIVLPPAYFDLPRGFLHTVLSYETDGLVFGKMVNAGERMALS